METEDSPAQGELKPEPEPEPMEVSKDEEIEFVCEGVSRPVVDIIDLLSSDDEQGSAVQALSNVKPKDYVDLQKDRVASTLDRLARHVEVERIEKEARNKEFLQRKYSQHAHGLQELEFIKGHKSTEEAQRCVDHWLKMPGLKPGSINTGRRVLPAVKQAPMINTPITCPVIHCKRKFDNGHLLLGHLKRFDHSPCDPTVTLHGTSINSYACVVCFRRFTTEQQYQYHLLSETEKNNVQTDAHSKDLPPQVIQCFACPKCFLLFNVRDECLQHMSATNHFAHRFELSDEKGLAIPLSFPSYAKKILISMCKDVPFQVRCTACHLTLRSETEVTAHFKVRCRHADPAAFSEKTVTKVAEAFILKGYCVACKIELGSNEEVRQHNKSTNHNARLVTTIQESLLAFSFINEGVLNPRDYQLSVGQSDLKLSMLKRAFDQLGSKSELLNISNVKGKRQAMGALSKPEDKRSIKTAWFCECNRKFQSDQAAETHLLIANRICYKCMVCGKKAEESTVIHLHMSRFHGGAHLNNFSFWCKSCSTAMPRKESAMAHVAEYHSGHTYYYDHEVEEDEPSPSTSNIQQQPSFEEKSAQPLPGLNDSAAGKWECGICEELFDCEESIQQHCQSLSSHQFHKVCCELCKMRFHKVETLYRHCQDQHGGDIQVKYLCGLCDDLFFVGEPEFLKHYKDYHSRDYRFIPEQIEIAIKSQESPPPTQHNGNNLTCGCLETYVNKIGRKEDQIKCKKNLLAKGTVWYSCSMCKATAQTKGNIQEHVATEHKKTTDEAAIVVKCGTCSKTFSSLGSAQQHYHDMHSFLQKPNLTNHFGSTTAETGVFKFTAKGACVDKQHDTTASCSMKSVRNGKKTSKRLPLTKSLSTSSDGSRESESPIMDTEESTEPSECNALPDLDYLRTMTHIVFVDLDNWATFFTRLPGQLNQGTFVWGFLGGKTVWKPPEKCPIFDYLVKIGTFFLHPRCSARKDAADFAICMHAGRMDEQLPKHIPFTILSGDKGFLELQNQFNKTQRPAHVLNPHHIDGDLMCALLNSIEDTTKESDDDGEDDCDLNLTMALSLKELQVTKDEKELNEEAELNEAIRRSLEDNNGNAAT